MAQTLAGHVTDEEGFKLEVWTEPGPNGSIDHVHVMFGGTQQTDFPFNQPNNNCELCEAAQKVAEGRSKHVTLPILIE